MALTDSARRPARNHQCSTFPSYFLLGIQDASCDEARYSTAKTSDRNAFFSDPFVDSHPQQRATGRVRSSLSSRPTPMPSRQGRTDHERVGRGGGKQQTNSKLEHVRRELFAKITYTNTRSNFAGRRSSPSPPDGRHIMPEVLRS